MATKKAQPPVDPNVVVFEPLPPAPASARRTGRWHLMLTQLLDHKDEWARIGILGSYKNAISIVGHLRKRATRLPEGAFEFQARAAKLDKDGKAVEGCKGLVYARYLGPEDKNKRHTLPVASKRSRSHPASMTFYKWLAQFQAERTYKGAIARMAYNDPTWPRTGPVNTFAYVHKYLEGKNLQGFEINQLDSAWKDYEVEREHKTTVGR